MNTSELRRLFVLANDFKEGDLPVGGTRDDRVRADARRSLEAFDVATIRRAALVDDGVTAALDRSRDRTHDRDLDSLTIGDLKRMLLGPNVGAWAPAHQLALPSEVIAALAKTMTSPELAAVSRNLFNPKAGDGITIGSRRHFGSRIQPNSPGDDEGEILFSILEGLSHGCGDVIIGLNPASDDVDTIARLEQLLDQVVRRLRLPTRYCVLSDIIKQDTVRARTPVDVGFQSLAGTSTALAGMVGLDADGIADLARGFDGLYFETGQGSAVTNGAAEGVDMVTLEARAYGVARMIQQQTNAWTIVNDVAGFIGPEVFRTAAQLERACLEDAMMAKLHGITVGLDVCATFHMGIPPASLREVSTRVVEQCAPAYLMAVAGNADPMLGYLTTSFRDHRHLRSRTGRQIATPMRERLQSLGAGNAGGDEAPDPDATAQLYATYMKAGGDRRAETTLADEGQRQLLALRERGFDLGPRPASADSGDEAGDDRLETIYAHARHALYAIVTDSVIRDASARHVRVRTEAADRDDYLAHPPVGERLCKADARLVSRIYSTRRPHVQIVISDGLNANAVNEHLRSVLPPVRRALLDIGCDVGATDVVVSNGRVRAGYHVGELIDADTIVHFVGERPGTGLNTLSAYLTYGRDEGGLSRWSTALDHSCTTAVCGIHPKGKPPHLAAAEIARIVARIIEQRRSGVKLR